MEIRMAIKRNSLTVTEMNITYFLKSLNRIRNEIMITRIEIKTKLY